MIARVLYKIITDGLAAFAASPALYQNLFGDQWGLSATEIAGIQATFAAKPISVKHGYALADFSPPQVTILLQNETQSDFSLGDYVGQDTYAQADGRLMTAAELGSFWDSNFQFLIFTENVDATSYLYEMVKASLICSKTAFEAADIESPMLSGMDLAPDARFLPEHVFTRALNLRFKNRFILTDFKNALGRVIKVTGIASPNVTPYSDGDIKTNISTITTKT